MVQNEQTGAESSGRSVRGRLRRYGPMILWMALIFWASTGDFSSEHTSRILRPLLLWLFPNMPEQQIAVMHGLVRKGAHVTEYAVFALLAARAFAGSTHGLLRRGWFVASLVLVALFALSDEFLHQGFVSSRTASLPDSLLDTGGGLAALVVVGLWRAWRRGGKTKGEGRGVKGEG